MCLFQRQLSTADMHRTGIIVKVNCRNSSETISCLQIRLNHELPCLGRDIGGLAQASSKTQIIRRTQSVAGDLGQPAIGTDQQGC